MSHTYSQLYYHLVWSTNEREPIIHDSFKESLYEYLRGGIQQEGGLLLKMGGVADHVHLLVALEPHCSLAKFVQNIKISSSKWVSKNIPKCHNGFWQKGYGAFSVSSSQKLKVAKYIENQEYHHAKHSFKDEFLMLLRNHNVPFDEKYLWK